MKKQDSLASSSEIEDAHLVVFISWYGVNTYGQFLWYSEKLSFKKRYPLELIKRRSKVHEKNMSRERTLIFDQS